jgi:hypothetical protein
MTETPIDCFSKIDNDLNDPNALIFDEELGYPMEMIGDENSNANQLRFRREEEVETTLSALLDAPVRMEEGPFSPFLLHGVLQYARLGVETDDINTLLHRMRSHEAVRRTQTGWLQTHFATTLCLNNLVNVPQNNSSLELILSFYILSRRDTPD